MKKPLCLRSSVMTVLDRRKIKYTPHSTGFRCILPLDQGSACYDIDFYQLMSPRTRRYYIIINKRSPTGLQEALDQANLKAFSCGARNKQGLPSHFPSCRPNHGKQQE